MYKTGTIRGMTISNPRMIIIISKLVTRKSLGMNMIFSVWFSLLSLGTATVIMLEVKLVANEVSLAAREKNPINSIDKSGTDIIWINWVFVL